MPSLDTRVGLEWPGCEGAPHPSRVEEHGSSVFAVLAPLLVPGMASPPGAGGPLIVSWTTSRGVHHLPSELLAYGRSGPARLWWLAETEPVKVVQRRAYVRVPANLVLRLDGPYGSAPGVSIDLSEGGVACRVTGDDLDPWEFDHVTLPIDDRPLVAPIRTVRVGEDPVTGKPALGVNFVDLPNEAAARLRRHVYARQIGLRRVAGHAG